MNRRFLSLVLLIQFLLLHTLSIRSQEGYNYRSMVVSEADLHLNSYSKDTTANAFFIYEKGFSRIENGGNFNLLTDYEAKIKILNTEGFEHSTINVRLYKGDNNTKETLNKIVAHTYNLEEGKIVKTALKKENIFTDELNDHYTEVRFTLPNVKPGSVIRYSYQKESPFIFNFKGWYFQSKIPKIYSEYVSDLPGNYIYNVRLIGTLKLASKETTIIPNCLEVSRGGSADCSHNIYVMKNIPAFRKEKYMTAEKNYFSRVEYELSEIRGFDGKNKKYTKTWKFADKFLKNEPTVGLQLKKLSAIKEIVPDSIKAKPNTLQKAKEIYNFIQEHYTWNGVYKVFKDVEIKNIIQNKSGNVLEMNIMLHNILKQQGFVIHPVLMSTRNNGYATKIHPVISDFNYLINQLHIDNKDYLIDVTGKNLAFGQLPFRCLNKYGRLLDFKNGSKWIDIIPADNSSQLYLENLELTSDLKLKGKAKYTYRGYHGYDKRNEFSKMTVNEFENSIIKSPEDIWVEEILTENQENPEKPFYAKLSFKKNLESVDNLIFIKPFTNLFFNENPFKLEERTYPVDFGFKDSYTHLVSIKIPQDYEFIDLPKDRQYLLPNNAGKVSILFQRKKQILNINHKISFLSEYYAPQYYPSLKELFKHIVNLENNTIITVRKAN